MFKKIVKWIGIVLAGLILIAVFGTLVQLGRGGDYYNEDGSFKHITAKQSFNFVVNHPAFSGFGQYFVPCEGGFGCAALKPLAIDRALAYIAPTWDVETDVNAINFLIDEVNAGKTIFYDYYSAEDKSADPSKEATGLFFIEGDPGAPFALVLPGGGFTTVAMYQEGFPIAQALHEEEYNVFILKYRVGGHEGDTGWKERIERANLDIAAALEYIVDNNDLFHVSTEGYSVWGFSAGGTLALQWGSSTESGFSSFGFPAPAAIILGYPAASIASTDVNIPTFIVICKDDEMIAASSVEAYAATLSASATVVEFHMYETGGHGFGVGVGTDAEGWMLNAIDFWERHAGH